MVKILAMLTKDDLTIKNAHKLFEASHRAPTQYWGFKDTGISTQTAGELARFIRDRGKTVVFESFAETEDDCLRAAEFAIRNQCRYLIGCEFYPSVVELLHGASVNYRPTIGRRANIPRYLYGTMDEVVQAGQFVMEQGADGICLSMYRYKDGDPVELGKRVLHAVGQRSTIISGSINTFERLKQVRVLRPWAFTIGSALFDEAFGKGLDWPEQISVLDAVLSVAD
ncbi:hypothetical protein [Roseinatronobacter alkalisoli]|uniref:Uncharacterized protein n=1 Tax=Roseinatronobacter alkalisoli TaxID=3028235 RepID=A0ABT5TF14_9RHOB|nr:hypothetical protein [Roseinatronobacter sp. HJB301]MDD7973596.1 hypothetical protein [Roseinatronobacter sp. HJB301]